MKVGGPQIGSKLALMIVLYEVISSLFDILVTQNWSQIEISTFWIRNSLYINAVKVFEIPICTKLVPN